MHVEWITLNHGLQRRNRDIVQPTTLLLDKLNIFYTQFDVDNTALAMCLHVGWEAAMLTLEKADVRWSFKRVNPHKARGPDGIQGWALRVCADQLTEVFTNIFNLSLSQSVVPTPFKASTIVSCPQETSGLLFK